MHDYVTFGFSLRSSLLPLLIHVCYEQDDHFEILGQRVSPVFITTFLQHLAEKTSDGDTHSSTCLFPLLSSSTMGLSMCATGQCCSTSSIASTAAADAATAATAACFPHPTCPCATTHAAAAATTDQSSASAAHHHQQPSKPTVHLPTLLSVDKLSQYMQFFSRPQQQQEEQQRPPTQPQQQHE
eukprot:scpid107004/ scgid1452/ 